MSRYAIVLFLLELIVGRAHAQQMSTKFQAVPPLSLTDAPNIPVMPTGNELPSYTSLNVQTHDSPTPYRQYLVNLGFVTGLGVGQDLGGGYTGDRATLYVGIEAKPGGGLVWAENPVVQIDPGASAGHHQIVEYDMNNVSHDVDATPGPKGLQFQNSSASGPLYTYGTIIENGGRFTGSAASVVAGAKNWLRGFGCLDHISQSCFFDYSNSAIGLDLWGNHTTGIDFTNGNFAYLMRWGGGDNNGGSLSPSGDYEFGGAGDTAVAVKSSGLSTPKWVLQSVVSSGVQGRFRLFDAMNNVETFSMSPSGTLATFAGAVNAQDGYQAARVPGVSCPAGTVNPTTMVVTNGIITKCN